MIVKIDENTVKVVSERIVDLNVIRHEIAESIALAESIEMVPTDGLSGEVLDAVIAENSRRELDKSYLLEQARMKQEELNQYD